MIFARLITELLKCFKVPSMKPPLKENFSVNEDAILREFSDGSFEKVSFADLSRVTIATTDAGPYFEDLFFILETDTGGTIVSHEWAIKLDLLSRLEKLPNFNHEAVIQAMCCTDNNKFVLWQKD